jgi:hypothetical protein
MSKLIEKFALFIKRCEVRDCWRSRLLVGRRCEIHMGLSQYEDMDIRTMPDGQVVVYDPAGVAISGANAADSYEIRVGKK